MNLVQRLELTKDAIRLQKEARAIHQEFRKICLKHRADIRAINIAAIEISVDTQVGMSDASRRDLQERFLKSYVKAADAPFTFYKLGQ